MKKGNETYSTDPDGEYDYNPVEQKDLIKNLAH
jgi:hypothetical protein